jgi:hypothetical protein
MSLINEALKRAEEDKRRRLAAASVPLKLRAATHDSRKASTVRRWTGLLVLMLLIGGGVSFAVLHLAAPRASGRAETTAPADGSLAALPGPTRNHTQGHQGQGAHSGKAGVAAVEVTARRAPHRGALAAKRASMKGAARPPRTSAALPVVAAPKRTDEAPVVSRATTKPTRSSRAAKVAKVQPPEPKLVLNGIMFGEEGKQAVINNRIVGEGQTVAGAKVLRITSSCVEVEVQGKVVTLRM